MSITRKEIIAMNHTASQIKGVFDTMQTQLATLESEIKRDEEIKISYEIQLKTLTERRNDIQKSIDHKEIWVSQAESGPFAEKYNQIQSEIEDIYNKAKEGHRNGIKILEKDFNYHPAFKRPGDTFSASAFTPK